MYHGVANASIHTAYLRQRHRDDKEHGLKVCNMLKVLATDKLGVWERGEKNN